MRGLLAVGLKELRQIRRDRRTLTILVFIPAFFLFLYGYALNFDIRHIALGIQDRDQTSESRSLIAAFESSTYFDVVAGIDAGADLDRLIDEDRVRAALVIPEGFGRDLGQGATPAVQIVINGDNANTATTVLGYVNAVVGQASVTLAGRGARPIAAVEPRVWYNPELRSTLFLVPGLIAFISMITAVISTALSIVREKERGTMEQIRMAPLSTASFVLGKTLPYLVLSQLGAMLIVLAAMIFFGLPMRGSWLVLFFVITLFLAGALGTGLFISTVADTQQVAFQAAALVGLLPTLILSGFIFPLSSMPVALQYISVIVPARYFLVALRAIVLKGLGLDALWSSIAALTAYAVAVLGLSAVRLGRR